MVQLIEVEAVAVTVVLADAVIEKLPVGGQAGERDGRSLLLEVRDYDFQAAFRQMAADDEGFTNRGDDGRCCRRRSSGQEKKSEGGK